jgi:hypothetical protein
MLACSPAAAAALGPRVARADGHRILVVGSSMIGGGFGLYLENALHKDHGQRVLRYGKASTSLARPDFFDWSEHGAKLVESFKPDVSVVMFGGNDVQGLFMGKKNNWVRWPDAGWSDEYARRVAAFAQVLAPAGQQMFWIGMPIMRSPKFSARMERINTIFRAEMAIRRNALFVETWGALTDRRGVFSEHMDVGARKRVRVRAGDGVHVTPAGAHVLKSHVLSVMVDKLALCQPPGG